LRPANLRIDPQALHAELVSLAGDGMDSAWLYRITDLVPPDQINPAALWDIAGLENAYHIWTMRLTNSTKTLQQLDDQDAARETLLIGRAVTRLILIDPLLPGEMIDTKVRGKLIRTMREYDRVGKRIWRKLYQSHRSALPGTSA
jgi:phenylacetic acid degradation operon negative regulatory protein